MRKVMATIVMDEDVFDELCTYPEHRVEILNEEYCEDKNDGDGEE